jgi:alpha-glucosidase
MFLWFLAGCLGRVEFGDLVLTEREDGGLDLARYTGKPLLTDLRFAVGRGDETWEFQAGSYRKVGGSTTWTPVKLTDRRGQGLWSYQLVDADNVPVGELLLAPAGTRSLSIQVAAYDGNRVRFDAACTGDDHFVGGGEHAMDLDHVGEAFDLWVSEPGIGKVDSETPPADWFITGTRHASSTPDPFFVRPEPVGVVVETLARVSVDLCTGDRWRLDVADAGATWQVIDADTPMAIVEAHALLSGPPVLPPDWAFAAWADAVRGSERVRAVAAELREAGAAASVIWSEDWRGGESGGTGYHPIPEWDVDADLYPATADLDAELEAAGFKWLAYFAPSLVEGTRAWDEAIQYAIRDDEGEPYTYLGPSLTTTTAPDLTDPEAVDWALGKMEACLALGFDGWMADYGEWLPTDAQLANGDAEYEHSVWPLLWQDLSAQAVDGHDAVVFGRSGWTGVATLTPVHWPGDQRTSFDADDGLPSVLPMTLGASVAGIPLNGSDIAGYQSFGNDPSDKELWMRWAALGAFSPIMRTHHGAFSDDDWQFDSDEETLAAFAELSRVHVSLFPYLRGLAEAAATRGTPLVRPLFFHHPDEDWGRIDVWLLGPSLLVAPVLMAGATTLDVALPGDTTWFDWWTGAAATSGSYPVPLGHIPVFAPAGAVIPTFTTPPDSLVPGPIEGLTTLAEADTARTITVFAGANGSFTEADGTSYTTEGKGTASASAAGTFKAGTLEAGGVKLTIDGPVERTYTMQVWR